MKKYDLSRMLKEIEEDGQIIAEKKHEQLAQSQIRKLVADLRQKKKDAK